MGRSLHRDNQLLAIGCEGCLCNGYAARTKDIGVLTAANSLPQSIAPLVIGLGSMTALGGYPTWYLFGALVALSGAVVVYRVRGVR